MLKQDAVEGYTTSYGFTWGAAKFTRLHCDGKAQSITVGLVTPQHENGMQIYVTQTGKVRIFGSDGMEWKPASN